MQARSKLPLLLPLLLAPACSSTGGGSAPARPEFRPVAGDETLLVWTEGLEAWMPDPKDAALRAALPHVAARLRELAAEQAEEAEEAEEHGMEEVGEEEEADGHEELEEHDEHEDHDPVAPFAAELGAQMLMGPMCLRAGVAEGGAAARMPVWGQVTFRAPDGDTARERAQRLTNVLSAMEVPSLGVDEAFHGLSVVPLGPVELHHGVARDGRADTVVVAANGLRLDEVDLGTLDLPEGVRPVAAFKLDYRGLRQLVGMFGGEEATSALDLTGMGDVVLQGGMGHGPDRGYSALRTIGWVSAAQKSGSLPQGRIPRRALERIPADATAAMLGCMDFGTVPRMLTQAVQLEGEAGGLPPGMDPLDLLHQMTGFDLERDLIDHLGETYGVYLSDSTGGGGLYSAVAFLEVADEAGLRKSMERLEDQLADLAEDAELGGVDVRHWQHGEADVATLVAPGLPIPLELSWTLADGWLVVAASSQGLKAALDQAKDPHGSLLDHAGFRAGASGRLDDLMSLTFVDVPRFVRDGYPLVGMLGAALSGGLSSPDQPERVPLGMAPTYAELARGARATVSLGRIEGDDLVVTTQGDRSMLVQLAGMAGAMGPLPMLALAAIAGEEEKEEVEPFLFELEGMDDGMEPIESIDEAHGMQTEEVFEMEEVQDETDGKMDADVENQYPDGSVHQGGAGTGAPSTDEPKTDAPKQEEPR